jgi:type II secretory pathway component PulC
MSQALQQGIGTSNDLVAAYAWLKLFSETSTGSIIGRVQMNNLALKMETVDLERAQSLFARFKAGNWQPPVMRTISAGDSGLKLSGITIGAKISLAVINGETLSEGESTTIRLPAGTLKAKCLKIEKDSVLISIEGEDQPRILRLSH